MGNCQCTNADDAVLRVPNNGLGGGLDDDDSTSLFSAASHWSEMGSPQTQKMRERNVRRNKELEACRARHFELTKKTDAANAELSALEAAKATACANIDFNEAKLDETTREKKQLMVDLRAFLQQKFTPPKFSDDSECAECLTNQENEPNFSVFRRRHHCRRCGRSLCDMHCSRKHDLPVYGIKDEVRVCESCWKDIEYGETIHAELAVLKHDEEPEASLRWIDKAAKLGFPRGQVSELVTGLCEVQDVQAKLKKSIEHAEARCTECSAVLEMKKQACSHLEDQLRHCEDAMAGLERKLTRLDEGSSSEGRHDSDDEENRSRHSADSKLSADESDGPLHRAASPLDGVAATQQSIERHSGGRHPLTQVTPNQPVAQASSEGSNLGVSPRCVSWYEDGAALRQPVVYPEWVELALVMGYGHDITKMVVKELMSSPPGEHTFERFVDMLDALCPSEQTKRASHELRNSIRNLETQRHDLNSLVDETRARIKTSTHNSTLSEDMLLCNVCYHRKVAIIFKCGHLKCEECANILTDTAGGKCPDCRATLKSPRRAFFPGGN